jgi:hypothetical protein
LEFLETSWAQTVAVFQFLVFSFRFSVVGRQLSVAQNDGFDGRCAANTYQHSFQLPNYCPTGAHAPLAKLERLVGPFPSPAQLIHCSPAPRSRLAGASGSASGIKIGPRPQIGPAARVNQSVAATTTFILISLLSYFTRKGKRNRLGTGGQPDL